MEKQNITRNTNPQMDLEGHLSAIKDILAILPVDMTNYTNQRFGAPTNMPGMSTYDAMIFGAGMGYAMSMMNNMQPRNFGAGYANTLGAAYGNFNGRNDSMSSMYGMQDSFYKKGFAQSNAQNPTSKSYIGTLPSESLNPYGESAGKAPRFKMPPSDKYRQAA